MSRFELLQLIQERGAFGLRRALADVGVTVDSARSYGSSASVRDAVAVYGIRRRMLHIAEVLDPMTLKDASCHHLGNFAVQVGGGLRGHRAQGISYQGQDRAKS